MEKDLMAGGVIGILQTFINPAEMTVIQSGDFVLQPFEMRIVGNITMKMRVFESQRMCNKIEA